ncbi:hypothetical protein E6C60_2571 [Paenibacillus algicola]|uniref:Phage protein Gp138 N-terminal domain-containing protein n=1 Tax=Paenibacillus algicola TaxID=2565926 RepID=A0A4P8XLJ3_9BACL|nr:Gp138 family membrane-puncturing spike protein [Paenibacillus algicola]QCT03283.1 hypothetical protein E6C60_2571 [Paenibacillus algicola]
MRNDPAATLSKLIEGFVDRAMGGVHVGLPCRVISFNESTCRADVQPLIRTGDDEPAVIQNVPALGRKRKVGVEIETEKPFYEKGDIVLVVCADREIKNALGGKVAAPDSTRSHDINDAVIVGVFM